MANTPRDGERKLGGCWQGPNKLPYVRFDNQRETVLLPSLLRSEIVGQGVCSRMQIPCKMAWAVTIHKSQGMSLDAASVQAAGSFDDGMAYVALSRVRSLTGLRLRRPCTTLSCAGCDVCRCQLSLAHLKANEQVSTFYSMCQAVQESISHLAGELVSAGQDGLAEELHRSGPAAAQKLLTLAESSSLSAMPGLPPSSPSPSRDAAHAALLQLVDADRRTALLTSWRTIPPKQEALWEDQA